MLKKNNISRDGDLFRVKINVLLYEEDKCYVAYCLTKTILFYRSFVFFSIIWVFFIQIPFHSLHELPLPHPQPLPQKGKGL